MTYQLMEIVSGGRKQLVSTHTTMDAARAALPPGEHSGDGRNWWVAEDGRVFVIEAVVG